MVSLASEDLKTLEAKGKQSDLIDLIYRTLSFSLKFCLSDSGF